MKNKFSTSASKYDVRLCITSKWTSESDSASKFTVGKPYWDDFMKIFCCCWGGGVQGGPKLHKYRQFYPQGFSTGVYKFNQRKAIWSEWFSLLSYIVFSQRGKKEKREITLTDTVNSVREGSYGHAAPWFVETTFRRNHNSSNQPKNHVSSNKPKSHVSSNLII